MNKIVELGLSYHDIAFGKELMPTLFAKQRENGRAYRFVITDLNGFVSDLSGLTLTMEIGLGNKRQAVEGKNLSLEQNGAFVIEIPTIYDYGCAKYSLTISDGEKKLTTKNGDLFIEQSLIFNDGEGGDISFDLIEFQRAMEQLQEELDKQDALLSAIKEMNAETQKLIENHDTDIQAIKDEVDQYSQNAINEMTESVKEVQNIANTYSLEMSQYSKDIKANTEKTLEEINKLVEESNTNALVVQTIKNELQDVLDKELERQANEEERINNEKGRQDMETLRRADENTRREKEIERVDNEGARIAGELDRQKNEKNRQENENKRLKTLEEFEELIADPEKLKGPQGEQGEQGPQGEQGIQGEQGPQGPPGEVTQEEFDNLSQEVTAHKEEYTNQRQQDQLKIATVEKELNDYKSTMANINVNQEVKQKVSGYGSVSLPKNAANGQVSVSLKGNTVTDENGTKSTISASRLKSVGKNLVKPSHFHINKTLFGNDMDAPFKLRDNHSSIAIITPITPNMEYRCSIDSSYKIVRVVTSPSSLGIGVVANRDAIPSSSTILARDNDRAMMFTVERQDGKTITHDDVINCKLQLEQGTVPTPYEPYTESTQYLPNVGELRSLPNGVRDEIRVVNGKAELVKRVSDTIEELAEPIVTPIEVSGTLLSYPSGTVYVEKVLPVAGIYTDEIAIAHTDFPISSLDKISKVDFATGVETQLDVSKAVVATDKLSFTHTDLTSGDIVFFEYFYANESTQGELELEYYDSRHVLKDSVTGKFYKIIPTVANGVLTNGLLEV